MSLVVSNVAKTFGRFPALKGVSLEVAKGEFLALLGPSGSGKTTLLRILAGLERPDSGAVTFDGEDFLALTPRQRRIGMVFQHYALFRHMTVAQNIAFGLKVRPAKDRPPAEQIRARVMELLRLVQLEGLEKRYPSQLSGGQRQRVALARALAIEPRMLLLDEPFGALDAKVRRELRRWLRHVHEETGVTTIFVTHDQEEAMDLADRVAVLKLGEIEQVGAPTEVWNAPASGFVFDFLGEAHRAAGLVENGRLKFLGGETAAPQGAPQGEVEVFFRSTEIDLEPQAGGGFPARVRNVVVRGQAARVELRLDSGEDVDVEWLRGPLPPTVKAGATVRALPERPRVFPAG